MTCIICHGENVEMKDVNEELRVGNNIVYVPIRVLACQTCGERYYDRRTVQFLEEAERRLQRGTADLQEVGKVLIYG